MTLDEEFEIFCDSEEEKNRLAKRINELEKEKNFLIDSNVEYQKAQHPLVMDLYLYKKAFELTLNYLGNSLLGDYLCCPFRENIGRCNLNCSKCEIIEKEILKEAKEELKNDNL